MSKFYKPIGNKMCVFPVGAVYLTMIKENPSKYYGGTWELISGGYIYATSSTLGKTDYTGWGAQSTTLSVDQIPAHSHGMDSAGGHSHKNQWDGYSIGSGSQFRYVVINGGSNQGVDTYPSGDHTHNIWNTGGSQGHTHNIATIDVFMYKRTA